MPSLSLLLIIFSIFRPHWDALALATSSTNDFSYMRAVTNATELPLSAEYDYVVVGGGTAGCPLAATLSRNFSVLVLERGSVPQAFPDVLRLDRIEANIVLDDDGFSPFQPFRSLDGVPNGRGRILGGTSMVNFGLYSRAEPEFYRKSGLNWDPNLVERAYQWVEEAIVYGSNSFPYERTFVNASLEAGVVPDNGFTLEHRVGTKVTGSTFDRMGRRHGAVELLNRGDLERSLLIGVGATVDRVLFSSPSGSGLKAIGVVYRDSRGRTHRALVRPKGEVILSAGAIGSPQLLLLSGVGPSSDLSSRRIPVMLPQPNVGKFMADNPRSNVLIVLPFTLNPSYVQAIAIAPEFYVATLSSLVRFGSLARPSGFVPNQTAPIDLSVLYFVGKVPGPASTNGSLALVSSIDSEVSPNVRFNYFSNASDLAVCVKGVRKIGDILSTKTLAPYKFDNRNVQGINGFKFYGQYLPEDYATNDAALEKYCRLSLSTWYHYHGGCVASKVVDGDFRVKGINGLRVVDGSVFTVSPGTNPQATMMMMGRYAGLKLLQERT